MKLADILNASTNYSQRMSLEKAFGEAESALKAWSDRRVEKEIKRALHKELVGVQRELGTANIAGTAKWYVEDRLAELKKEEA